KREEYRQLLADLGVRAETVYLATPRSVVLARLAARSGTGPDDVVLDPATAAAYLDQFEVPGPDEGPVTVVRGGAPSAPWPRQRWPVAQRARPGPPARSGSDRR